MNDYTCKVQSHFKTTKINKKDFRGVAILAWSHEDDGESVMWSDGDVGPFNTWSDGASDHVLKGNTNKNLYGLVLPGLPVINGIDI